MRVRLSINLLLRAGFRRLWRSAAFWGAVGVMFAAAVFELAVSYPVRQAGLLDNRYMIFALLSGVVLSAFCSLFTGAEYSDGTMRNKIVIGHYIIIPIQDPLIAGKPDPSLLPLRRIS